MDRSSLLLQKMLIEGLVSANLMESEFIGESKDFDLDILETYYLTRWALLAEHLEIVHQLKES